MAKKQHVATIRCEPAFIAAIQKAAKAEGYASPSSYIRQACVDRLNGVSKALSDAEEKILATLQKQSLDLHRLQRATLIQHAALDSLVKLYMTYTPEMPLEIRSGLINA